ncbi:MAG: GNAT family N-acetyltransferase [Burkholderiales bacterium PBB3]|nr:MAG: GNAT family N-acetyltransferase [Burkholderiales bacterium PBB3]
MPPLPLHIRLDDLSDSRIAAFLEKHLQDMRATSPPESVHALDLAKLRDPSVYFWSAWVPSEGGALDGTLVGTAAIKRLDADHAELKSMRTSAAFRGKGIAKQVLLHVLAQARALGLQRLSLETGTQPFFAPAHSLYLAHGFAPCDPFGSYTLDPHSRFLTMAL